MEEAVNNYITTNNTYNTTNIAHADVINVVAPGEEEFVVKGGVLKKYNGNDTDVVIPDGVKVIGPHNGYDNPGPFFESPLIQSITIPSSVEMILARGVSMCKSLREIRFSEGLRAMEEEAFAENEKLTEISLPDSLETIGKGAFSFCTDLRKVRLPKSLRVLPYSVFAECSRLKEIVLPDSLEEIGKWAFGGCRSLEKLSLPEGLKRLDSFAFADCSRLEEINIPQTITHFDDFGASSSEIFKNCHSLRSITVGQNTPAAVFHDVQVRQNIRSVTAPRG